MPILDHIVGIDHFITAVCVRVQSVPILYIVRQDASFHALLVL